MTQQELAKKSRVPQSAISEIETGESQSPVGTNLVALAQTLHVNPVWLAQGEGPMEEVGSPLPHEGVKHAKEFMKLAPEVRKRIHEMVIEMVKASAAEAPAVADEKVEAAYGHPGRKKNRTT